MTAPEGPHVIRGRPGMTLFQQALAENERLRRAGYVLAMELLQSGVPYARLDDEARAACDAFLPNRADGPAK